MKRLLSLLLLVSMIVLMLVGCGSSKEDATTKETTTKKPVWYKIDGSGQPDPNTDYKGLRCEVKGKYWDIDDGYGQIDGIYQIMFNSGRDSCLSMATLYQDGAEITGKDQYSGYSVECTYKYNGKEKECRGGSINSNFTIKDDTPIFLALQKGYDVEIELRKEYASSTMARYEFTLQADNLPELVDSYDK